LASDVGTIYIQQDNAMPHLLMDYPEFVSATSQDGFDIQLICQPPNSPGFNVLDLEFFNVIQLLQHMHVQNIIDEFIEAIEEAYEDMLAQVLNSVFRNYEGWWLH
jgi:hypothetical protein